MFEAAELGRELSKEEFREREPELRTRLLALQREARAAGVPILVIVSGVEGAGKGGVVNRLQEWLDSRGVEVVPFWDETDEERERPRFWRFWRRLPARGSIGVFFGSWYTRPIVDRAFDRIGDAELDRELKAIAELETMLAVDGALIVKLWFHLSKKEQRKRLREKLKGKKGGRHRNSSPLLEEYSERYDHFVSASERALRLTDSGTNPWHVIESGDRRYRDVTMGTALADAIAQRLAQAEPAVPAPLSAASGGDAGVTILDRVDLSRRLDEETYERELDRLQRELNRLTWKAKKKGRNTIAVMEGWDAAGKGGAIRRAIAGIDARLYRVIPVAAPTDEERAHHYLWRFWRHVPRDGYVTIYDRSWYGRVLVERVEGFATREEWSRAYQEINLFEEQLCDHGAVLMKFWVHLSPEEQLRRFEERARTPWKAHKITDEDWRNREKWDEYKAAVNDMVVRTSTSRAPWTLVPGDDKRVARVEILQTFCQRLGEVL